MNDHYFYLSTPIGQIRDRSASALVVIAHEDTSIYQKADVLAWSNVLNFTVIFGGIVMGKLA